MFHTSLKAALQLICLQKLMMEDIDNLEQKQQFKILKTLADLKPNLG